MSCEKVTLACENDGEEEEDEEKKTLDFKFTNSNLKKKQKNFRRRREVASDDETKCLEVKSDKKPIILHKGDRVIELK